MGKPEWKGNGKIMWMFVVEGIWVFPRPSGVLFENDRIWSTFERISVLSICTYGGEDYKTKVAE